MRLVLAALSRPLTVVVALIAIALCAVLATQRMPVDIFPQVGDPAIYVAQPYGGMDPAQMEGYLTYYYEYHFLYITGIDHVESKSIQGAALMKLVFHEGTNMSQAMSETVGYVNRARVIHAARNGAAVHHALRRGQRRGGPAGLCQRGAHAGRDAGFRIEPRAPAVRNAARRFRSAALRRQPAHHRHHARPGQAPAVPDLARRGHCRGEQGHVVMPSGNMWTGDIERIARTNAALGAESLRTAERSHPAGFRRHRLSARYRNDRERDRYHHRLRARERKADGIHTRDQARGRFHAGGDRCGEEGHSRFQESPSAGRGREPGSSINRRTSQTRFAGW